MNICLISNLKPSGYGESTRPYYLAKELRKHGHNVLHVCDGEIKEADGISYINKNAFKNLPGTLGRAVNVFYLKTRIARFKPDLIYAHQFNNGRWAIATRALPKVPLVFDAHTSAYFENKVSGEPKEVTERVFGIEKEICQKVNYIIAASSSTRQLLLEQYNLNADKVFVVGNATSIKPVGKPTEPANEKFICATTLPFDGFVANELALQFLFKVAAEIYRTDRSIEFHVVGGGKKPEPPTPNIIYTGYVKDLEGTLLQSDICLAPYPDNAVCGGIRNKVCDYLALGKAIVSTEEGMRGFIDLTEGAHYLKANSINDFAAAILQLKSDKALIRKLEQNALDMAPEYQWENRGEQLNTIFKKLFPHS